MDGETKKYLEEKFGRMATKDDLGALETRIGDRFNTLEEDLAGVGSSVSALASHVDERFDALEEHITILTRDVAQHGERVKYLEDRLPRLAR
jgi:hypothetical protein